MNISDRESICFISISNYILLLVASALFFGRRRISASGYSANVETNLVVKDLKLYMDADNVD